MVSKSVEGEIRQPLTLSAKESLRMHHPWTGTAGFLFFATDRFVAVAATMTCGWNFISPTGWCAHTAVPASREWLIESIDHAMRTSENLQGTEIHRDREKREALNALGLERNNALWVEIRKAYKYRTPANARASTWMVAVEVTKTEIRVCAIIKNRNGTWGAWESPHTSKRILLPLNATAEEITDATLKMLTLSTLRGLTMQEAFET
ncbi:hypothetical protein NKW55_04990 [Gluconobacter kondonii]|uniref:hypothetical protein n=1 Tax=Gluconobacter kondonii TaxID=941463 RepID=UPI0020A1AC5D|nr:hypothetical protein [Gluconobacter kondonii]MCP1235961.1 hypothetical protein [Gluconobacter kondonii]